MSEFGRRFDPAELDDDGRAPSDAGAAGLLATGRELEAFAQSEHASPTFDFEDRVMAAIRAEAPPRAVASGSGVRGLLTALRDAWRITWSRGRPLAVRAQAIALVLIAAVAIGSVGGLATVGVVRLLAPDVPPAPSLEPVPSPSIVPGPSPSPSAAPSPSPSVSPSPSPSPLATAAPTATDDGSGAATASPTDDDELETPEPDETPGSGDDSSGPGSGDDSSGPGSGDDSSGHGSGGSDD